jgi:hypothetical protein
LGSKATNILARLILSAALLCFAAIPFPVLSAVSAAPVPDTSEDMALHRETQRKAFSDAEIIDGFLKIAFGAEFRADQRVDRIRKYDQPIRIFVDSRGEPDRSDQISTIVADIRARIRNLDITVTPTRVDANMIITLVLDSDLQSTIRTIYGPERARNIERSLRPQCLAGFAKDRTYRIQRSEVLLVIDEGDFIFYDCAYEEILQALGPINDDRTVPWSMFNDDVSMGFFDIYDQILLNLLYDPRIQPGMTKQEIRDVLPEILPDVRAFVARTNNLQQ